MSDPDDAPTPRSPRPPADTIPAFWRSACATYGDSPLLVKDAIAHGFNDFDVRSAALARGLLAEGATKGSRIGLLAANGPEWVAAWLAINRIGALAVCLSSFASAAELAHAVIHADLQFLITADAYLRHDYLARFEEALPGLAEADGRHPLALRTAPYLRGVWVIGDGRRTWTRGGFEDLAALGDASNTYDSDFLSRVEAQVSPADWSVVIYTSGSTAFPKAVVHTQGTVVRKTVFLSQDIGMIPYMPQRGDRTIVTAPFFWVGGMLSLTGAMLNGTTLICVDDHSPRSLFETIRDQDANQVSAGDAMLNAIRDAGGAEGAALVARLRPQHNLQVAFFKRLRGEFADRLVGCLGMTETFGPHSGEPSGKPLPDGVPDSVGPALDGMQWKIVDPETGQTLPDGCSGELCVRGAWLMDGMYKRERRDVFDADGYYHTGDGCTLRPDGYLIYDSRISGMIKTSGANVSPEEVELAIRGLAEVVDVAVVGLPDPKAGQLVAAAVVRAPGGSLDEAAVRAHALSRLSSFKAPRRVLFFAFEDLPRTPSGKVRKPALTEMIVAALADEAGA